MTTKYQRPARLGDIIATEVQNPIPDTLRVRLDTPEAVAEANELIASGRWHLETDPEPDNYHFWGT